MRTPRRFAPRIEGSRLEQRVCLDGDPPPADAGDWGGTGGAGWTDPAPADSNLTTLPDTDYLDPTGPSDTPSDTPGYIPGDYLEPTGPTTPA